MPVAGYGRCRGDRTIGCDRIVTSTRHAKTDIAFVLDDWPGHEWWSSWKWTTDMSHPDAFALKNSGLNAFLFAEVGTELNGSQLTILSVLARLGQDPWDAAARWAELPRPAIIDCLVQSIAQMPMCPQALVEARVTASRLVQLLPAPSRTMQQSLGADVSKSARPGWLPLALICGAIAVAMAVTTALMPTPTAAVVAPTEQTVQPHAIAK